MTVVIRINKNENEKPLERCELCNQLRHLSEYYAGMFIIMKLCNKCLFEERLKHGK